MTLRFRRVPFVLPLALGACTLPYEEPEDDEPEADRVEPSASVDYSEPPPDWIPPESTEAYVAGSTDIGTRLRSLVTCPTEEQEAALQPGNLWAGDERYYVVAPDGRDTNPGTEEEPWATIQHASNSAFPGDTILIKDGVYEDSTHDNPTFRFAGETKAWNAFHTNLSRSGAPGRYITFRNFPGHRPIIDVRSINGFQVTGSYIRISGFEVRGIEDPPEFDVRDEAHLGNGISIIDEAHHVQVRDMIVHDVGGNGIGLGGYGENSASCNVVYHAAHRSDAGNSGFSILVANNPAVHDEQGYGFSVVNNVCFDVRNLFPFSRDPNGLITDGNCIIFDVMSSTGYPRRSLAANNLAFNNGGRAVHVFKSSHVDVIHNTGYWNVQSADVQETLGAEMSAIQASDVLFQGNIAYANESARPYVSHASDGVVHTENLAWGGYDSQSAGASGIYEDPLFVAPQLTPWNADFRVRVGSPAIDAGQAALPPAAQVPFDLVGAVRELAGRRTLGALESN